MFKADSQVFSSLTHTIGAGRYYDAANSWSERKEENMDEPRMMGEEFKLCARELQNYDGVHRDMQMVRHSCDNCVRTGICKCYSEMLGQLP